MAVFPAIIDACVLFNAPVRDTLLRLAEHGLYRIHWSQIILDETTKNLVSKGRMIETKAEYLVSEMSKAFPEAMIEVSEDLIDAMKNDPKDRHVAAAAVASSAQVIVTFNTVDFKSEHLSHLNVEAQNPDTFLLYMFRLQPQLVLTVLIEQAEDLTDVTLDQLLTTLAKYAPKFAEAVQERLKD